MNGASPQGPVLGTGAVWMYIICLRRPSCLNVIIICLVNLIVGVCLKNDDVGIILIISFRVAEKS